MPEEKNRKQEGINQQVRECIVRTLKKCMGTVEDGTVVATSVGDQELAEIYRLVKNQADRSCKRMGTKKSTGAAGRQRGGTGGA